MDAGGDGTDGTPHAGGGRAEREVPCLLAVLWGLLGLAWALGTPSLVWGAMISSAPFFGEQPTADELALSRRLLLGALACGFLAPMVGASLALWFRRRVMVLVFVAALGLTVLAGATTGILSKDSLRWMRDELMPPPAPMSPAPRLCQEHSGGDSRCPGG